jgi:hypothetical protein
MLSITVTTLSDSVDFNDGVTSLREAIFVANTVPGADTITFSAALTAAGPATILLTHGELKITDSLTINGPGADLLTIDASGNDPTPGQKNYDGTRVFAIDDGNTELHAMVSISEMTVSGADVSTATETLQGGGGIASSENLTITNCRIVGNDTSSGGGGIGNFDGTLAVISSIISGNSSRYGGGGITNYGGSVTVTDCQIIGNQGYLGAGIWSDGFGNYPASLSVIGTLISGNKCGNEVGGGGGIASDSKLSIANCIIEQNTATGRGGGVLLLGNAESVVRDSVIRDNKVLADDHREPGNGGGVYGDAFGQLQLIDCTISGNSADGNGGGVYGRFDMLGCTVSGNSATAEGGGVDLLASGSLVNCTITGNQANDGGGVFGSGSIEHCTIVFNRASLGDGVFILGSASISGTIVAVNSGIFTSYIPGDIIATIGSNVELHDSFIGFDYLGVVGESLPSNPSFDGNLVGGPIHGSIYPKLGPLTNNGGPTLTFAPLPGSPVLNRIFTDSESAAEFDQRGVPFSRSVGGAIDIGAVESQPNPLTGDYNFDGVVNAADYVVWRQTLGVVNDLRADGDASGAVDVADYGAWANNVGNVLLQAGAASVAPAVVMEQLAEMAMPRRPVAVMPLHDDAAKDSSARRPLAELAGAGGISVAADSRDRALLVWLSSIGTGQDHVAVGEIGTSGRPARGAVRDADSAKDGHDSVDRLFDALGELDLLAV